VLQVLSEPLVNWKYEMLYIPFLLPFAFASAITVLVHRRDLEVKWTTPFKEAFQRVAGELAAGSIAELLNRQRPDLWLLTANQVSTRLRTSLS
jgi:hypothetical protein